MHRRCSHNSTVVVSRCSTTLQGLWFKLEYAEFTEHAFVKYILFKLYKIFMLHVFCLCLVRTMYCSLYIFQWSPSYKARIPRGHRAMQQIKLTQNHFLLRRGQPSYSTQGAMVLCRRGNVIRWGILRACVRACVRAWCVRAWTFGQLEALLSGVFFGNWAPRPPFQGLDPLVLNGRILEKTRKESPLNHQISAVAKPFKILELIEEL